MANIVEVREMSDQKLQELLENAREELFNLRFQHAAARVTNTIRIRDVRREVAQVESVLYKRQLAIAAAAAQPEIAAALHGKEWDATARYVYEDSAWLVRFNAGGSEIASAHVDLNKKMAKGRRARDSHSSGRSVRSVQIK